MLNPGQTDRHIRYLKQGIEEGFDHYFNKYFRELCYFADSFLDNRLEAEDVVQEIFLRFWERRKNFDTSENVKAWLFITTRNECFSILRAKKVETKRFNTFAIITDKEEMDIEEIRIKSEVINEIVIAIDKLPSQCRKIFILKYISGLKQKQIADQLGLSTNTVKNQLQRAYQLLRLNLVKHELIAVSLLFLYFL